MKFINDKKLPMLQRLSKKLNKKLTFIDIETNELLQNEGFAIIQLALIQISEDNIEERVTYVDPDMPIKEFATKLTGITDETVESAPKFQKFVQFINKVALNDILMGFNTKTFVAHGLVKEAKRYGVDISFPNQIDIKPLLLTQLNEEKDPKLNSISLEEAKKLYGIKLDEGKPHQADFDLAGTVFLAEEMLMDYGLKYFEKDYHRFLNKNNPEPAKKEKSYYNRELPNLNEVKPHMLEFIINSEKRLTDDEVAKQFGFDAFKISFILTDLINTHHEVREKLKNPETIGWLSDILPKAIDEVWSDEVSKGKLKPLFTHLNKIKPRDIDLDYTQLRIAIAELNSPKEENKKTKKQELSTSSSKVSQNSPKDTSGVESSEKNNVKNDNTHEHSVQTNQLKETSMPNEDEVNALFDSAMPEIPFDQSDFEQQAMISQSRDDDAFFSDDFTAQFEQDVAEKATPATEEKTVEKVETSQVKEEVPEVQPEISPSTTNSNTSVEANNTTSNNTNRASRFARKASTVSSPTANQEESKPTHVEEKVSSVKNEVNSNQTTSVNTSNSPASSSTNDDFNLTINESDIEKELSKPKKRFSIRR